MDQVGSGQIFPKLLENEKNWTRGTEGTSLALHWIRYWKGLFFLNISTLTDVALVWFSFRMSNELQCWWEEDCLSKISSLFTERLLIWVLAVLYKKGQNLGTAHTQMSSLSVRPVFSSVLKLTTHPEADGKTELTDHILLSANNSPCGSYVVSCPFQDTGCVGVSSNMLQMVNNVTYDPFAVVEPIHEKLLTNGIRIRHNGNMMFQHGHS